MGPYESLAKSVKWPFLRFSQGQFSGPWGRFGLISVLWTPVDGKGPQVDFQPGSSLHGCDLGRAKSRFWAFKVKAHGK